MPAAPLPFLVSVYCTHCIAVKDLGESDMGHLPPMRAQRGSACCDACDALFSFEVARLYVRPRPLLN
jgi:hypothetical protein